MDAASSTTPSLPRRRWGLLLLAGLAAGCSNFIGTTARSFLGHVRNNPDPNVRFLAYSKLGSPDVYDTPEQKDEAVRTLIEKFSSGREPVATKAMICRSLGELRDPRARELMVKAVSSPEPVIKIEACRALGKVGRPEDATVLAQVMSLDNLEDARVAAIDGLAELKTSDPRIHRLLIDGMEHDDPAIRLASLNTLRKISGKDLGTDVGAWRKELRPEPGPERQGAAKDDQAVPVSRSTAPVPAP
ncbi:MAG: HEAT repeat domain-containing protein [Isosphaeraceae bacterium]